MLQILKFSISELSQSMSASAGQMDNGPCQSGSNETLCNWWLGDSEENGGGEKEEGLLVGCNEMSSFVFLFLFSNLFLNFNDMELMKNYINKPCTMVNDVSEI